MAHNDSFFVNTLAYTGLRTVGALLNSYDVDQNMALLGDIGDWWYRRDARRRARAVGNICQCFPEMSVDEAEDLAHRSMRHLLQLFVVEVLFTPRLITPGTWHRYVELGKVREALKLMVGDRPAIFITGHCGNFEILGFTLATVGFPMTALARPLDLPKINDWLVSVREKRGMSILTKFGATERLPAMLKAGGRIAFTADQNAGDRGMFVPFFGRLASAYKSIGLLAMSNEVPIICGYASRTEPNRFQYRIDLADVIQPEEWAGYSDPLYYITARYTRAIEQMVRQAPEQYFWIHRRWKSRPRHEKRGKPMPDSLRRKIAELPWVDEAELERITDLDREAAKRSVESR